jgi:hypothetical protein
MAWLLYAVRSALAAALTAVLSTLGVEGIPSNGDGHPDGGRGHPGVGDRRRVRVSVAVGLPRSVAPVVVAWPRFARDRSGWSWRPALEVRHRVLPSHPIPTRRRDCEADQGSSRLSRSQAVRRRGPVPVAGVGGDCPSSVWNTLTSTRHATTLRDFGRAHGAPWRHLDRRPAVHARPVGHRQSRCHYRLHVAPVRWAVLRLCRAVWLVRPAGPSALRQAVLVGGAVVSSVMAAISAMGALSGVVTPVVWGAFALEVGLAGWFGYYLAFEDRSDAR